MAHKYFADVINGQYAELNGAEAEHISRVLRAQVGDIIILGNAEGTDYEAQIDEITQGRVGFKILSSMPSPAEPDTQVHLFLGQTKGDKLEWAIQKSVELGCFAITPFYSENSVVKPKNDAAKNERYNKIAKEAAKQSARGIIPKVFLPVKYTEIIANTADFDHTVFCYEHGGQSLVQLFGAKKLSGKRIAVIIGPEGGFSPTEAQNAENAGCLTASLGPRILRSETAPLAALSAIMLLSGNMN